MVVRRTLRVVVLVMSLAMYAVEVMAISLIARPPVARQARLARCLQRWLSRIGRTIGVRIRQHGGISGGPVLVVANHVSWLDVVVLGTIAPMRFVAKSEVRTWPVIGPLVAAAGTLFITRGDGDSTDMALDEMTWALAAGATVAIFPEGTSTDGSVVHRFRPRLIGAACRTGTPVQAVAIVYCREAAELAPFTGDDAFMPHLWRVLGARETVVEVWVGLPVATLGRTPRALAREAHAEVVSYIGNNRVIRSSPIPSSIRHS